MFDTAGMSIDSATDVDRDRGRRMAVAQQTVRSASTVERRGMMRALPVLRALRPLLPDGALRRGSTVAVTGSTALALALVAEASAAGSWCAVVGCPWLGVAAAAETGICLSRLALVPEPGRQWTETVAALIDGVDVVVAGPPARLGSHEMRRLSARARERGTVVVPLESTGTRWEGADIRLTTTAGRWEGIDDGIGRLRARRLTVEASGRGAAARPRRAEIWLPARSGAVLPVLTVPTVPTVRESVASKQLETPYDVITASRVGGVDGDIDRGDLAAVTRLQPAS